MQRFDSQVDPSGKPDLERLYKEIVSTGFGNEGAPLNWFTSQAARPDILAATWALVKGILVEGQLPGTLKQMIAMTVSAQNSCRYCEATHTGVLQSMGVSEADIRSAAQDPEMADLPPAFRAALRFALKAAREPNAITDDDYAPLREAGFRREEILEIAMMAAFTQFINTWADAAGIPLDSQR